MIFVECHKILRVLSILILTLLILTLISIGKENATFGERISPEKRVAYMCRPGVVMITNHYNGNLVDKVDGTSRFSFNDVPFDLPSFSRDGWGSGSIISSNGYIVTNAHVVHDSDEVIQNDFAVQATRYVLSKWKEFEKATGEDPSDPTEENRTQLLELFSSNVFGVDFNQEIKVYYGMPSSSKYSLEAHPAEIRKISPENIWLTFNDNYYRSGKDLAILKIEGVSDLPSVILGDSNNIEVGDKVIVIGFPGTADSMMNPRLSPDTNNVPTVTSGIMSAVRKLPDGSDIIQTDASIFHGNSGGPAFDENGKVIGIATFCSGKVLVSGEWLDIQGFNFLIPVNMAKSFISELNINTTPSKSTIYFEKGLDYYWDKKYRDAEMEFNKILTLDPENIYALDYAKMSMQLN
jgi:S1-C subfamily serine protease